MTPRSHKERDLILIGGLLLIWIAAGIYFGIAGVDGAGEKFRNPWLWVAIAAVGTILVVIAWLWKTAERRAAGKEA